MPEPLTDEYLKTTQQIIAAVPPGPWEIRTNDHNLPDSVGPIAYVETWAGHDQAPVVQFIHHAREAIPRLIGEVSRLADRVTELERRIQKLENPKGGDGLVR